MNKPTLSAQMSDASPGNSTDKSVIEAAAKAACNAMVADIFGGTGCIRDQSQELFSWPRLVPVSGSYYHKVTGPYGQYIGISAEIKLGTPEEDPRRFFGPVKKPLDGFSSYLGGNVFGKHEVDAGMTWSITRDANGKVDYKHKAWRPFWRDRSWHNAPAKSEFYWQAGDTVDISLVETGKNQLQLFISDAGINPKRSFTQVFQANGFDPHIAASFKRVDSIDQVHREGKSVVPTTASLRGVAWLRTDLLASSNSGAISDIAMDPTHRKVIEPLPYHIFAAASASEKAVGAEHVDIFGVRPAAAKL